MAIAVAVDLDERFSIMVNEEDHLRLQVMCSGLDLQSAWERIDQLDDLLELRFTYAFHDTLGYLTACPTNVGTGLRVSVMLHLPALVVTREIEKVFRSLQKINVAVRGLYGEGSQFMGDFYQVSNQITLGRTEQELVETVSEVVPRIVEYERTARDFLVNESEQDLHDDVSRAYGILCTAKKISSEETLHSFQGTDGSQFRTHSFDRDRDHQQTVRAHTTGPFAEKLHGVTPFGVRSQHRKGRLSTSPPETQEFGKLEQAKTSRRLGAQEASAAFSISSNLGMTLAS